MRRRLTHLAIFTLIAAFMGPATSLDAQVDRLKRAVKKEVKKAERDVGDMLEGAVRCALGDDECVEEARQEGKPVVITDDDGNVVTDENGTPAGDQEQARHRTQEPGEGVWRNYDFVPGDTVWRATDFASEPVGRFPASQLEFVKGNMQIVEVDGAPALEVSSASVFRVKLPRELPDDFTLEFDLKFPALNMGTTVYFAPLETSIARYDYDYVLIGGRPGLYRKGQEVSNAYLPKNQGIWVPVKLQVDSAYAILYVGTERAAQVPTANLARTAAIEFHVIANPRLRAYLKNVVVAVGLNKLYDALTTTGEVTTRGIFFDVDSDRLRPESTPVLQEILTALQQHGDLRITIEGHTDSQGEEGHNQELSERRARAVVAYLEGQGIDGGRLSATGKGESAPMADNATAEGRQQNRRVVLRVAQ